MLGSFNVSACGVCVCIGVADFVSFGTVICCTGSCTGVTLLPPSAVPFEVRGCVAAGVFVLLFLLFCAAGFNGFPEGGAFCVPFCCCFFFCSLRGS